MGSKTACVGWDDLKRDDTDQPFAKNNRGCFFLSFHGSPQNKNMVIKRKMYLFMLSQFWVVGKLNFLEKRLPVWRGETVFAGLVDGTHQFLDL